MSVVTISVVIPLFNHEKFIARALYSAINQSYPPKEIIVIDDGSTDSSPDIVEAIAAVHPEIIFWRQQNRGAHKTINAGIQRANGDLVAILNSDDMYEPLRLEKIADEFEKDPGLDVVVTGLYFINQDGQQLSYPWHEEAMTFFRECGELDVTLINGNIFVTTSNIVARRSLFFDIGFFSDLRYAHDLDFFLRLIASRRKLKLLEEPYVSYRIHSQNTISEGASKVKVEWAACVAVYLLQFWSKNGGKIDWSRSERHLEVLRKHGLTELVLLFLAYFHSNGTTTLERDGLRNDENFVNLLWNVL